MRASIENVYELAPVQQGILMHTLTAPNSGIYFEQFSWTIHGNLNVDTFRGAWQHMIDRHALLRTSFSWEDLDKRTPRPGWPGLSAVRLAQPRW